MPFARLDPAPDLADAPRTKIQSMLFVKPMKLFVILPLAAGLLAGCTAKDNQTKTAAGSDAGAVFLAENAKKDGIVTTASGLQYKVLQSGTGESPQVTDRVQVHYHGTLTDGTVFDSSVQRGEPVIFPVGAVIPGWVEALQLMKVGDKWQLFIPARLAYGDRSPSPVIPPNSVLIFEVELLGIEK
jgi:FKBP-type peptidyl-prolyl cis-trans isomerase FklB